MKLLLCTLSSLLLFTACGMKAEIFSQIKEEQAIIQQETLAKVYRAEDSISIHWKVQLEGYKNKDVSIEHSLDGGLEWQPLATVPAIKQGYSWTTPKANIANYKVQASFVTNSGIRKIFLSTEPTVLDNLSPIVTLNNLRGREILRGGSNVDITWSAQDLSFPERPIDLFYSTDEGSSWLTIADGLINSGRYTWTIPTIDTNKIRIKIIAKDSVGNTSYDYSESNLTIDSTPPSLQILYPIGGESFVGESTTNILWTAADKNLATNPIKIEISTDAGVTWTSLTNATTNSGSLPWNITEPNSITTLIRLTVRDLVGHLSQSTSGAFTISRSLPKLTLDQSYQLYTNSDSTTYSGTCDLGDTMTTTDVTITGPTGTLSVPCSGSAPTGTWSFTTAAYLSDAKRLYTFSQTNTSLMTTMLSSEWIRDTVKPTVTAVNINNNDEFAQSPFIQVNVIANDENSFPLNLYLEETANTSDPCDFSKASAYQQNQPSMTHPLTLSMGFLDKKICAWAADRAGNLSLLSDVKGSLGVDMDTISFDIGSPPKITFFKVSNPKTGKTNFNVGDTVKIEWSVTDNEGLANKPMYIEYSHDGETWHPIVSEYGNLSGNPTSYSGSYENFTAPSTQFMQVRLRAKDKTGNFSYRISSNSLNSGSWSIFAGNGDKGFGSTARTAVINRSTARTGQMAIHPITGDVYVVSDYEGLLKIDINTGIITKVAGSTYQNITQDDDTPDWSVFKISENGEPLGSFYINTYINGMAFDNNGKLYLNLSHSNSSVAVGYFSSRVYQIDLDTMTSRLYAGGGTAATPSAGPLGLATELGPLNFDEDNSLYLPIHCSLGTVNSKRRMLFKITQDENGLADQVIHVAGNCQDSAPVSGTLATNTSFAYANHFVYGTLTIHDHGKKIYYSVYSGPVSKIINGVHYSTAINKSSNTRQVLYSPKNNILYVSNGTTADGSIEKWNPSFNSSAGGETLIGTEVSGTGTTAECLLDEVLANDACVTVYRSMNLTPQGKLLFIDSPATTARIRYIDETNKVRTLAGSLPFYGKGLDKSVLRTSGLGSIFNKTTTEPGSIYTPALYFMDGAGQLFGRIGSDNLVEILWGNQKTSAAFHPAGTQTSPSIPIGQAYANDARTMTFDSSGLPWIRYNKRLISLTATGLVVARQTSSNTWDTAAVGSNPALTGMHPYGLTQNLYLKGSAVFMMGRHYSTLNSDTNAPLIRLFDFANSTITHIMGGVGGPSPEVDHLTATDLSNVNLSSICVGSRCSNQFVEGDPHLLTDDKLYFSEGMSVRVITNPLTPGAQTLKTLFTSSVPPISENFYSPLITNFFMTPDETKVFYIYDNKVYCESIQAPHSSWCNGSSIGPNSAFGKIEKIPNQFTMLNSNTLLISTGRIIIQYEFPSP